MLYAQVEPRLHCILFANFKPISLGVLKTQLLCLSFPLFYLIFILCRLVIDRETGKPKGYGFCEYKDEETALSARRNLQGYEINGRQLRVDFAENDKGADRNREQVKCELSRSQP